ncbi:unnamed protein product, partial [Ectocarpus sp. 6 AP-2014]
KRSLCSYPGGVCDPCGPVRATCGRQEVRRIHSGLDQEQDQVGVLLLAHCPHARHGCYSAHGRFIRGGETLGRRQEAISVRSLGSPATSQQDDCHRDCEVSDTPLPLAWLS